MIQHFTEPYEHWVIDNFFPLAKARKLSQEFPDYNSDKWFVYNNPLENKKTINNWFEFPALTYSTFAFLNSPDFIDVLQELTGTEPLFADPGLHGGGWHAHGNNGLLNVHLDYSIHPKMKLLRKYNLIIYLNEDWKSEWGGNLELWSHDTESNLPKNKVKSVECNFNRAVLFDASQKSWHGFFDKIKCPEDQYRKSLAVYYLTIPFEDVDKRERVLYAPSEYQKGNTEIQQLIEKRSKW